MRVRAGCEKPSDSRRSELSMHFLFRIIRWPGSCSFGWCPPARARRIPGRALQCRWTKRKIVEQFASQRTRLLVTGLDRAARPTVEVAHEALIRTWPRLRQWIDSD